MNYLFEFIVFLDDQVVNAIDIQVDLKDLHEMYDAGTVCRFARRGDL